LSEVGMALYSVLIDRVVVVVVVIIYFWFNRKKNYTKSNTKIKPEKGYSNRHAKNYTF